MIEHSFFRQNDDELIVIPCTIDNSPIALALDTGASHTTIDLTPILLAGYDVADAIGIEKIATGNGVVDTHIFILDRVEALGISKRNFKVCSYDFFAYHYSADFEGVLGLDFLQDTKFCVDMEEQVISIQHKKHK